jgi:transcriptional antiterminator NusG
MEARDDDNQEEDMTPEISAEHQEIPATGDLTASKSKPIVSSSVQGSDEILEVTSDQRLWYVIHCYSGYENKVRHNLEQRIETMGMKKLKLKMANGG